MNREKLLFNNEKAIYELMKDKKAEEYIDTMGMTTLEIENFCEEQILDVSRRSRDSKVEDKLNPPLMASFFYYYIYFYQKIPSQIEFQRFYKDLNEKWVKNHITSDLNDSFNGRLARFYASIMREFHFYHIVKESNEFEKVSYTLEDDIRHKSDLVIKEKDKVFGIQLRVKTRNSAKYALKKSGRGFEDIGIQLIDLPIDLDTAKEIKTKKDKFLFYDEKYIQKIKVETKK